LRLSTKIKKINARMAKTPVWDFWTNASTDGQRYILEWVLGHHD